MNPALAALTIALFAQTPESTAPQPASAPTGQGSALPEATSSGAGPATPTAAPQDKPSQGPEPTATDPGLPRFVRAFIGGGYSGFFVGCNSGDGIGTRCFRGDEFLDEAHGELRLNFGRAVPFVLALTVGYGGPLTDGYTEPANVLDVTLDLGIGFAFSPGAFEIVVYAAAGYRQELRLYQVAGRSPEGLGAYDTLLGASASFHFTERVGAYVDLSWRLGSSAGSGYYSIPVLGIGPRLSLGLTFSGER